MYSYIGYPSLTRMLGMRRGKGNETRLLKPPKSMPVVDPKRSMPVSEPEEEHTHLDSHDDPTGNMPHLVNHPVRFPAQHGNLLQVFGLHHKVLERGKDKSHGVLWIHSIERHPENVTPPIAGPPLPYLFSYGDTGFGVQISRWSEERRKARMKCRRTARWLDRVRVSGREPRAEASLRCCCRWRLLKHLLGELEAWILLLPWGRTKAHLRLCARHNAPIFPPPFPPSPFVPADFDE